MKRARDTHLLHRDTLTSGTGPIADVVTYKTRRAGDTWAYKTLIIGYSESGQPDRALSFRWSNEAVAAAEHRGLCIAIHDKGFEAVQ